MEGLEKTMGMLRFINCQLFDLRSEIKNKLAGIPAEHVGDTHVQTLLRMVANCSNLLDYNIRMAVDVLTGQNEEGMEL